MSGWVKLHRDIQKWGWKKSPNHLAVFIDLLLEANHEDGEYMGTKIPKGSLTTSVKAMAHRTGVSEKTLRTVLNHLKSTNEVAIKTTTKFTMISITKWNEYQVTGNETGKPLANEGQTTGKPLATNKNSRIKEDKNNIINTGLFTGDKVTDMEEFPTTDAARNVLNLMNATLFTRFGATEKNLRFVNGRLSEGFKLEDFKNVFEFKRKEWDGTDFAKYLRPSTLLGTKFDEYLSQAENALKPKLDPLDAFFAEYAPKSNEAG